VADNETTQNEMHRLLRKQIRKKLSLKANQFDRLIDDYEALAAAFVAASPQSIAALIEAVSDTYHESDKYQNRIQNALQTSTDETNQLNRDLWGAKEDAESSSRSKSEFLANMSHEIRTPMNGIIGLIDLLSMADIAEEHKVHLRVMHQSANLLLSIINDILDFSKIEAGKLKLEFIEFDLSECIKDTLATMWPKANAKGLDLINATRGKVPQMVKGDPSRMSQILINLINNSLKFTEEGSITIEAEVLEDTPDFQRVSFTVRDTGIGIDSAKQEVVFKAFEQADGSTTRQHGGTGLGLAISLSLVKLMKGKMSLESTPGEGSAFSFTVCFHENEPTVTREWAA
jgi:two-component system, sensor histidine kinase and response regulator